MPFQMAMAVAQGRLELNEALQRMAQRERVERLMAQHELSRALATQIAIGHADLDAVLAKRRMKAHREQNANRSSLDSAAEDKSEIHLVLHGQRRVRGHVVSTTPYTFMFQPDGAEPEEIHKLQVKYAYEPGVWKRVRKAGRLDRDVVAQSNDPIARPQDRYTCSDKRLFRYMDEGTTVKVTLLEGDVFKGKLTWFGRFEFGLQVRGDVEVVVFRHALHDLSVES